jgi:uncharacterized membrane protein YgaE (UPF0421/DUF939 family)
MQKKTTRFRIGLRTLKTAVAVVISMIIVDFYGATSSKLIFAMLGAMAAVQPTFKESLESCLTQIIGVFFGGIIGAVLLTLPIPSLVVAGIGIIIVITLYNAFRIRFSPAIPCFIVVLICTTPDIYPISYALGRTWDTLIGLGVGMLINTLVFPYDNSRQIISTMESLDKELLLFLEDMFDGDDHLPSSDEISQKLDFMHRQLQIFANQKFFIHLSRQKKDLERFKCYETKGRQLVVHMAVICHMHPPGRLNEENRRRLESCGAKILDSRPLDSVTERDIVTNYHLGQILSLRRELLDVLYQVSPKKKL